jgi:hypothetical protein
MKKPLVIAFAVLAAIVVALFGALHYASRTIEDAVLAALGPESTLGEVKVGLTGVELLDIRVPAPKGWPAEAALSARRVVLAPRLSQIFSDRVELTDVTIEDAYISAARPKEGGGLRVMPGLTQKGRKDDTAERGADIGVVNLENCTIDVYDASVGAKPLRVRVEHVAGAVKDIRLPGLDARSDIELAGVLKGPVHRGTISVRGWIEPAKKSSEITTRVRDADLGLFEPYIVQKAKATVEAGTFDLDLRASVRNNVLKAPGTLSIQSLKLKAADKPLDALADIPRRAAIGAVADKEDRITVNFTLDGKLDDPGFSIAGEGAIKMGLAFIKAFGFSFEGLVRAVYLIVNGLGASMGAALD